MIIENLNQITELLTPKVPDMKVFAVGCCDNVEDSGWDAWMKEGD